MVIRGNDTHEIINGASAIVYIFSFFILFYCFLFDFYSTYSFIFMFVMLSVVQCDTPTCWVQLACCTLRSARSGVSNKEKKKWCVYDLHCSFEWSENGETPCILTGRSHCLRVWRRTLCLPDCHQTHTHRHTHLSICRFRLLSL